MTEVNTGRSEGERAALPYRT